MPSSDSGVAGERRRWGHQGAVTANVRRVGGRMGKIQMFYFTLIIVFAYAAALGSLLVHPNGKIAGFPALGNDVVALLGISHATYLTTKAVTRTPGSP
jgi:hypothetical protein